MLNKIKTRVLSIERFLCLKCSMLFFFSPVHVSHHHLLRCFDAVSILVIGFHKPKELIICEVLVVTDSHV